MIKIGICDDRKDQLLLIETAVRKFLEQRHDFVAEILAFDKVGDFLDEIVKRGSFDVALLDICMPGMLGTDVAKEIRLRKDKTEIVFLTTSDEFAVDAFALKAAHYLLKPFKQEKFNEAIGRAVETVLTRKDKIFPIKLKNGVRSALLSDISYLESNAHGQTICFINGEKEETRETLTYILSELDRLSKSQFISPCKGYIVNQMQIRTISSMDIIMKNNKSIPIAQRAYRKIKDGYFDYMFGHGRDV